MDMSHPTKIAMRTPKLSHRTHTSAGVIGSSEDMLEIEFLNGKISRVGDQYGIGRSAAR